MKFLLKKRNKGQIFLMSLLLLSTVSFSALLLLSIFTVDLRQIVETSESVKAFYAADACMEGMLYQTFTLDNPDSLFRLTLGNETSCQAKKVSSDPLRFQSIGNSKSGNIRRGIEIWFE